jgi:hypothetical protein
VVVRDVGGRLSAWVADQGWDVLGKVC